MSVICKLRVHLFAGADNGWLMAAVHCSIINSFQSVTTSEIVSGQKSDSCKKHNSKYRTLTFTFIIWYSANRWQHCG